MADYKVRISPGGRIVIPAEVREALGVQEGDSLILRLENDEVRLLTPKQAIKRAQALVRRYSKKGRSLSEELLEERRDEAGRRD
ncbi:MAG: AbrB/MazE/SpoVT family DNA-binding domain-containing protein [Myxococcaceae bacterium]